MILSPYLKIVFVLFIANVCWRNSWLASTCCKMSVFIPSPSVMHTTSTHLLSFPTYTYISRMLLLVNFTPILVTIVVKWWMMVKQCILFAHHRQEVYTGNTGIEVFTRTKNRNKQEVWTGIQYIQAIWIQGA